MRNFGEIRNRNAIACERVPETSEEVFRDAFKFVMQFEKGVQNATDNLLRTRDGVSQKLYDKYRRRNDKSPRAIDEIEGEEVAEIYEYFYWRKYDCEKLPFEVSIVYFDSICQLGSRAAVKILQRALDVNRTGLLNAITVKKANSVYQISLVVLFLQAHERTIDELCEINPSISRFRQGYLNRRNKLKELIRKRISSKKGVSHVQSVRFENIRCQLKSQTKENRER